MIALLAIHGAIGLAVMAAGPRAGRVGLVIGGGLLAGTLGWTLAQWRQLDVRPLVERAEWVPALDLAITTRLDRFGVLMIVLVAGIGALVCAYAFHYMGRSSDAGRLSGLLIVFAGAMVGVVVADNVLFLYVCWELTSVTSYLLIGIDDRREPARAAALHALLVTGFGGLAMLAGLVMIGHEAGTFSLAEIIADPPEGGIVAVAVVLVLLGAMTKSAQYPFHSWLPGAMIAPTPVSAYLHSAAMVKAGVYLVARLAPAFADVGPWRPLVVGAGVVTMIAGGLRALRPDDLKQVLAYGTVSQLGFLMVLFGIGHPEALAAGTALLLAHGLFKAALFMVVGIVEHQTGTRDISRLPRLSRRWRPTQAVAVVSAASMAAVPPLAGFLAKEQAYAALVDGSLGDRLVLAGVVAGSVLTVAYSTRIVIALVRPDRLSAGPPVVAAPAPGVWFLAPATVLATATVVLGVVPRWWNPLADGAAQALDRAAHAHLVVWHGITAPLVLSVLTLASGLLLVVLRRPVAAFQARWAPSVDGVVAYRAVTETVLRIAARTTAVVQSGSLPVYAAVILTVAAVAPMTALVTGTWWPGWPDLLSRPIHAPIAALLVGGAVAATLATRRFAAALLLGLVGYGMAALFVVQGAPDLALTQFAVETLSVVIFLLVLRHLPDRFERRTPAMPGSVRIAVAMAVGTAVTVLALVAPAWRTHPPVSDVMMARALPDGDGRNVVNVILVDIRGLDTLGEATVLVAAALGITSLARAGRPPRTRPATRWSRRRIVR